MEFIIKVNDNFNDNINCSSSDLCIIIGNILENAFNAAKNSGDNNLFINFSILKKNNMLIITVDNSYLKVEKIPMENISLLRRNILE